MVNYEEGVNLFYCNVLQDRKVFKFYRRLISFHEKVDPVLMLRTTNPVEVS